ncbi:efflux RND transporter permease subunit [Sphingomonas naphthae]|uniref:Efflux pump membrane transporter n=1 Tax=Sphingomonas naphthae TaxID=1813468 RepID=A0ABY7TH80_9SPHN|nr:efflux RND transporter permease subunit [Sphingomonas naphthae]WCT72573.1 efflux RND transporter permease subunit [Sphingomonas naphthae]
MISRVFIDRPILAWVIAIIIMMGGIGGIMALPVEQYPDIAPPQVNIRATYPGASAEILESSVTQVIEQQLTGIDGMLYFTASSSSTGSVTINCTFNKGTDPDIAQVQVQNRVQQALARLPSQVQQQGLTVTKSNPDFLLVMSIADLTDKSTNRDIADFMVSNLQDQIGRLEGVGDINVFGAQYAMRIWLDPFKLQGFNLQPSDVTSAITAQNTQVGAGQLGAQPSPDTQMLSAIVTAKSRLQTPEEFRNIVLRSNQNGAQVLLKDVARVELGSENYNIVSAFNGHPGAGLAVSLAPGGDALKTAETVKKYVTERAGSFPAGYEVDFPRDSTPFIQVSIEEVVKALFEAIVLVVIVMFVFLGSWRATLIPAIAVPVVLLGTFGVLAIFGYSINTMTMFGLVLAIGLLVDDAIVVVENVERVMHDEGLSPRDATIKSMGEIQTALIAIGLVLSAVFLPMAFFGGSTGVIYRQFSITVVSSMVLSVVVALSLSPALTSTLLKPVSKDPEAAPNRATAFVRRMNQKFNAWFERVADRYLNGVKRVLRHTALALGAYVVVIALLCLLFFRLPTGFLPGEDQGLAQIQYTLPPGATIQRTVDVAGRIQRYFNEGPMKDDIGKVFTVVGNSQQGSGQNAGQGFIALTPWEERKGKDHSVETITQRAQRDLGPQLRDAQFFALNPPAVRGLGQSSGFSMQLLNTGGLSREQFKAARDKLIADAGGNPSLSAVRTNVLEDVPTLHVNVDEKKVGALGIAQTDVNSLLGTAWGGAYVNDFVDRGRVKRVYVQGDAQYRGKPEDLSNWFVRTGTGTMAPFSSFSRAEWTRSPVSLNRFNGTSSYEIQGQPAAGGSSGDAMAAISELAAQIPGTSIAWSGLSYQERLSGGQAPYLYGLSLIVIFLCLAALYESWSIPLAVILVIPLGLVGAALAVTLRGLENDVYFQVGLLTTMGLSAKNAILIIEFAEQAELNGKSPMDAALEAARLRLRPILMTSLAFIFGVLPLAIATGAGAKSRVAIGTAVMGGMITATVLAIFLVPLFFVLVRRIFPTKLHSHGEPKADGPAPHTPEGQPA